MNARGSERDHEYTDVTPLQLPCKGLGGEGIEAVTDLATGSFFSNGA
ncbi:MAG: hypothetical protein R3E08_04485 [Thiotrichaceae bacterium]